ncbi:MAG: hypothetical protein HY319_01860 [Armatimonadetes bacterium]|nr:hypothetical protein [Armatimonadota bacterium]
MRARYGTLECFLPWRQQTRPIPWEEEFEAQRPLEVEIGFGNGEFLVRRAGANPERSFVGLEMKWGSIRRALRRIEGLGLRNVRLLQVDARVALHRLFRPRTVDRFYSLFPCPWPKGRHAHHRLFGSDFLVLVNSRLTEGGSFLIVTDYAPFRDGILKNVAGTGLGCRLQVESARHDTKYERLWLSQGQQEFYELHFWKESHRQVPVAEESDLETHFIEHFQADRFHPEGLRGQITVEFKDFLYDPVRRRAMVGVFASEPGLAQRFWVEIALQNEGNRWAIFPAPGTGVVPVLSVQRALELVHRACRRAMPENTSLSG